MKLTFLGTRGAIELRSRLHRRHASLLVVPRERFRVAGIGFEPVPVERAARASPGGYRVCVGDGATVDRSRVRRIDDCLVGRAPAEASSDGARRKACRAPSSRSAAAPSWAVTSAAWDPGCVARGRSAAWMRPSPTTAWTSCRVDRAHCSCRRAVGPLRRRAAALLRRPCAVKGARSGQNAPTSPPSGATSTRPPFTRRSPAPWCERTASCTA